MRKSFPALCAIVSFACGTAASAQAVDGYFKLQTLFQAPENKCFEGNRFAPESTLQGAAFMDTCQNVSGQYWKAVPANGGYFKLKTLFQGEDHCLEGNAFAPSSTLAGAAFMDTCQNVSGQLWKIVPAHDGYFRLKTLFQGEDHCLEGNRFAPESTLGGAAFMDTCQNVSGQYWKITGTPFPIVSDVPHDVTSGTTPYPAVSLGDLSKFAWDEFIALNHPADPNHRGQPLAGSNLGDAAEARVWETYWHRVEAFPGDQMPVNDGGKAKVTGKPTYAYTGFALDSGTFSGQGTMNAQLWNNLDEDNELNVDEMFAHVTSDPDSYTDDKRIVYEAKINEDAMNYVLSAGLYDTKTRDMMVAASKDPAALASFGATCGIAPATIVSVPCGQIGGAEGNIEVKAAWRALTAAETASGKYYTNAVIRYQAVSGENKWFVDTYGLIGLHIIHKTVDFPSYVFATFEHVDNIASGIGYLDEISQTGRGNGDTAGEKVLITERDNPIPTEVAVVNGIARAAISDTVFSNYQLTGVQAYPVDYDTVKPGSGASQSDISTYFLANIVIESNEELQSFRGLKDAGAPDSDNIVIAGKSLNMGGCMGCHGVAEQNGADFSFLIKNGPFTAPEVVGGAGVIDFIDVKTYKDVQSVFNSYLMLNGITTIGNSPHKKFWDTLSHSEFISGDAPGTGLKIVTCGDSGTSNLIKILKGPLGTYPPQMPEGGPYMPEEQIDSLAKWIDGNCPENG